MGWQYKVPAFVDQSPALGSVCPIMPECKISEGDAWRLTGKLLRGLHPSCSPHLLGSHCPLPGPSLSACLQISGFDRLECLPATSIVTPLNMSQGQAPGPELCNPGSRELCDPGCRGGRDRNSVIQASGNCVTQAWIAPEAVSLLSTIFFCLDCVIFLKPCQEKCNHFKHCVWYSYGHLLFFY